MKVKPLGEVTEVATVDRGPGAAIAWVGRKVMAWYAYAADLMALVYLSLRELFSPVERVRRTASGVILRQICLPASMPCPS